MSRVVIMAWAVLCCALVCAPASAQTLRDPTLAPPEMGGIAGTATRPSLLGSEATAVIVRDGKSYLVVGSRLYAPGQKVGQLQLERITETQVWLREGKTLHKLPRFAGIERRVAAPEPANPPVSRPQSPRAAAPNREVTLP